MARFTKTFTVSDYWVCPSRTTSVDAILVGGGGGGGRGAASATAGLGGSGGGAGQVVHTTISVIPGTVYAVAIGGSGNGGTSGSTATAGTASQFNSVQALGGGPGTVGASYTTPNTKTFNLSGGGCRNAVDTSFGNSSAYIMAEQNSGAIVNDWYQPLAGCGGPVWLSSLTGNLASASPGGGSPASHNSGGAAGSRSATVFGGGGGGGGGYGGVGGAGSNGNSAGTTSNGTSAAANSGAGGGGSGASSGVSGNGGAGGSGLVILSWEE